MSSIYQGFHDQLPQTHLVGRLRIKLVSNQPLGRWDIADIAVDVGRFRRPHAGTPEDDKAWGFLACLVERLSQQPS